MDENTWAEFGPYDEYGDKWRESLEIDVSDVEIDVSETYVDTGELRETSPNGVQCTIETPHIGGQTGFIEYTKHVYAIRDNDGAYWVMFHQIECELC